MLHVGGALQASKCSCFQEWEQLGSLCQHWRVTWGVRGGRVERHSLLPLRKEYCPASPKEEGKKPRLRVTCHWGVMQRSRNKSGVAWSSLWNKGKPTQRRQGCALNNPGVVTLCTSAADTVPPPLRGTSAPVCCVLCCWLYFPPQTLTEPGSWHEKLC